MNDANKRPTATIGSWVKVREHGEDEPEVFRLGAVTRPHENQLAPDNPMGKALLGAQPGDVVTVAGPTGEIKFSVLDVRHDGSG